MNYFHSKIQSGFTLIEMVMVIAITGVLSAIVAVFVTQPVTAYFDSARRAALTDVADTALRRIARDVHIALPNSLRQPVTGAACIELLPTSTGGRYRAQQDCSVSCTGDILDFSVPDSSFDVLGGMLSTPVAGDQVVVLNTGTAHADAYIGENRANITSASISSISISPTLFPMTSSPHYRFQVIPASDQAVFYSCAGLGTNAAGDGTGILYRFSHYGINSTPASSCPSSSTGNTAILATNVSACSISYDSVLDLLSLKLSIRQKNEEVSLFHQVHVDNVP